MAAKRNPGTNSPKGRGGSAPKGLKGAGQVRGSMNQFNWMDPVTGGGKGFASGKPKPTAPTDPVDPPDPVVTPQRTVSASDIDWALSTAWTDSAVRAGLVAKIENAVATGELNAFGDATVFEAKMWNMLRETPEYKARFPGLARAEQGAGYNPLTSMTPSDYMKMEGLYDNAMSYYGIPGDVFNRSEMIADLVVKQVTPQEMAQRIQMAADAAAANSDVTAKLLEYEGIDPGHIIAFYLNPDDALAAIQKKQQTLQIGGMMSRYGFAGAKNDAAALQALYGSDQGLSGEADTALRRAASRKNLMSGVGDTASESEVLQGSASENEQAQRLRAIAAQREGRFATVGGAAEGRTGVSGLGSASTT